MSAIDVGGAQRFCLNICKYFNYVNQEYIVIFLRKGKNQKLRQEFEESNISFCELNCSSVMRAVPKFIHYANTLKPDVILSTVGNVDFAVSISRLFIPQSQFFIRKAIVIFDNQNNLLNRIKLKFEARVCNKLIALTNDMKDDFLKYGFKEENTVVINNMIDSDYINDRCNEKGEKIIWFDKSKYKLIIANARMVQEKRYDVLIDAFQIVAQMIPEARLLILGDGSMRSRIENMIPSNLKEKIQLLGFQNNPYYYMSNATVFAHTSDYEGFPNVVIEAMACGLPVVATNSKTGPREIIRNGVDGWVVNRGDSRAVADALIKILTMTDDEISIMSTNAKKKAQYYRTDIIGQKYIQLINDAL